MAEREESEGFFEMLWDCEHCGTKGLLGASQRYCPECGAPQNPAKRYMPTPEQQKLVSGHKYVGADRTCPACKEPQSAASKNCSHCGAPLDGAAEVAAAPVKAPPPVKKKSHARLIIGIVLVVVGLSVVIYMRCIRTQTAKLAITQHRWSRTIAIEEFRDQQQTAWRNEMPSDARMSTCMRRQRSTRQVPDGEDCHTERRDRKDGTFEQIKKCSPKTRAEPVLDDSCTFTVARWTAVDKVVASGAGISPGPSWPTPPNLPPAFATPPLGTRRIGPKTEVLTLDLGGNAAATQSCDVDDPTWRKYTDGQVAKVEVRASSGDVVCSSL